VLRRFLRCHGLQRGGIQLHVVINTEVYWCFFKTKNSFSDSAEFSVDPAEDTLSRRSFGAAKAERANVLGCVILFDLGKARIDRQ
jgi:hypothetical protein